MNKVFTVGDDVRFPYMGTYYEGIITEKIGRMFRVFCVKNLEKYTVPSNEVMYAKEG